jgi:asparagine synthetase B (glutamine-hydrolysing)
MSNWEKIDWSIYLHQIEKTPTLLEACERYEKDLKNIITSNIQYKKPPVLMLSGGVDSMLLGTILKKHFNLQSSITVACVKDQPDIMVASESAKQLGIENNTIYTTYEEVIDNLSLCKGKNIKTVFDLVYYLMFRICMAKTDVSNTDLIQGDGADTLLGSIQSFMYIDSRRIEVAKELGANPIMAFKQPDILRWVNRLNYDFSIPHKKHLHKSVIEYMGYNAKNVKRTVMQYGTGIYTDIQEHLKQITNAKNPNTAVRLFVNNSESLESLAMA